MNKNPLLIWSLGFASLFTASRAADLVPFDAEWSYMHPLNFTDPAIADPDFDTTWMLDSAGFNANYNGPVFGDAGAADADLDSGIGAAPIGYGSIGYINTQLGGFATELPIPAVDMRGTAYFRHEFTVAADVDSLSIDLIADDGAVIYLDGVELRRLNVPGDDLYMTMPAGGANENVLYSRRYRVGSVAAGDHVLAISLHQTTPDSSDLGFALRLGDEGYSVTPAGITDLDSTQNLYFLDGSENGWVYSEGIQTLVLDGADGGTIMSQQVDLTGQTGVLFKMDLRLFEVSEASNFEMTDSISIRLELDDGLGVSNVILTPFGFDTNQDGAITGDEVFPTLDDELNLDLRHVVAAEIPDGTVTARVIAEAVNDSGSEMFELSGAQFTDSAQFPVIGTNNLSLAGNNDIRLLVGPNAWGQTASSAYVLNDSDASGGGRVLATQRIDLSLAPLASVRLDLLTEATGTTAFENSDRFAAWVETLGSDGVGAVTQLVRGGTDTNADNVLTGAELTGGADAPTSRSFTFAANLPPDAVTAQIFIAAEANATDESFTLTNLILGEAFAEPIKFQITDISAAAGTSFDITFESEPAANYTLEFSPDLSAGSFTDVGTPIVGGAGATTTTNHDPGAIAEGFYRIRQGLVIVRP